ncbi:MAG: peptidoglycan DD-metalloendopeptidase family protein [Cetobacterium sp.]|nr:peptidoglycan DD-metalloendopeptidase family protein [Cetobacterium sp.]
MRRFLIISSFLIGISLISKGDSVSNLKNKIKSIDNQIKIKNTRIKKIDVEKIVITKQISQIEREIKDIEKDMDKIRLEMNSVNRNIDYGEKNLEFSSDALERKQMEYKAKILAWNRKVQLNGNLVNEAMGKRTFSRMLYGDLETMEHIKNVQQDIEKVKRNIQREKDKLRKLQGKLDSNRRSIERKIVEKNNLISRLNSEKSTHVRTISKLEHEKKLIAAQIERIIRERSKPVSNIKLDSALRKLGKLEWPVHGKVVVNFKEKKEGHVVSNGIEIRSRMGAKIKASTGGKVIYADRFQGLNNVVMIDYGYNTIGVYGNLISTNVRLNEHVKKGENIGILGLGTDGQPNLYYEIRFKLKPINPQLLF